MSMKSPAQSKILNDTSRLHKRNSVLHACT